MRRRALLVPLTGTLSLAALGAFGSLAGDGQLASASGNQPNGTCGLCVLAPSGESLKLSGSGNVSLTKANVIVNSSSKPAVALTATGSLKAPSVGVVGTASVTGSGKIENLTTGIKPVSDPLAGLAVPSLTVPNPVPSVSVTNSTAKTISPGVYKEIVDTSSGALTLNPGTYVVLQKFANTGAATLTAKGVSLYLACSNYPTPCKSGEKGATLTLTGSGPMSFTGPEEGCSPVTIFSDRNSTAPLTITGSGSQTLNGVIYAASGALALTGSGGTFTIGGPIVVGSSTVSGSGSISITGELPMTEGLALSLSAAPTSARVGETTTLTATLSCHGKALANQPVSFSISGANPHTETATTNSSGVATSKYSGQATGTDTATASYTANGGSVASSPATVTWSKALPAITTKPTASAVTLGEPISDTATIAGGLSPAGTVSFNVYAASDTMCKSPLNMQPLTAMLSGGKATSPTFTPTALGTYQFVAAYEGDSRNEATATKCGDSSEQVTVSASIGPVEVQPQSATVNEGSPATFTSTAAAKPAASMQWQVSTNGGSSWSNDTSDTATTSSAAGKTTSTLRIASAAHAQNGYDYRAVFSNPAGSVSSNAATLTVDSIGPVTTQPQSLTVNEGQPAMFTAAAAGSPAPSVQWQVSSTGGLSWEVDTADKTTSTAEAAATTSTLTVASASRLQNGYEYRAVFTNAAGSVTTNPATLTVNWIGPLESQPQSVTVNEGAHASFSASTSASPGASAQWQVSTNGGGSWSNDASDAANTSSAGHTTTSTLTVASTSRTQNGYEYRTVFTNAAGSATSNPATLAVNWIGPVTSQPQAAIASEGQPASFTAVAASNPSAGVQWQLSTNAGASWSNDTSDGVTTVAEAGQTTSTLTISSTSRAQNGDEYRAVFTNTAGSATSPGAPLTVDWIGPLTTQPESQKVTEGKLVTFTAAAGANPGASVQWQVSSDSGLQWSSDTTDGAVTSSSVTTTTSTLTISSASMAENGYEYRAVFTNAAGSVTSSLAILTVERAAGCTENYVGPDNGHWETASNWASGRVPNGNDVVCVGPGKTVDVTSGGDAAGVLLDEGGLAMVGGSLELDAPADLVSIPGLEVSFTSSLTLTSGDLSLGGELDVSSTLTGDGYSPVVSGSGKLVLKPGSTGTIDDGNCATYPQLNGATLVNDGTLTFGPGSGSSTDGAFIMLNSAQIDNAGTFVDDAYDPGCGNGFGGASIENRDGSAVAITNTGTFRTDIGPKSSANIQPTFNNSGTVEASGGRAQPERRWLRRARQVGGGGRRDARVHARLVHIQRRHVLWPRNDCGGRGQRDRHGAPRHRRSRRSGERHARDRRRNGEHGVIARPERGRPEHRRRARRLLDAYGRRAAGSLRDGQARDRLRC